jgi:excisionase family DNA binding protein
MRRALQNLREMVTRMSPVSAGPEKTQAASLSIALQKLERLGAEDWNLVAPDGQAVRVPQIVMVLLARLAGILATDNSAIVVSVENEVSTQQAAELLNVSRQYVVKLLDDGKIPYRRTGSHRKMLLHDVLTYKHRYSHE